MDLIVQKSKEVQKRLTNHGIGFYTSGQLSLEEYYALPTIGKGGLNTLHMYCPHQIIAYWKANESRDGNTRLFTATAAASMRESFGSDGPILTSMLLIACS